jgi:hypothetical protein
VSRYSPDLRVVRASLVLPLGLACPYPPVVREANLANGGRVMRRFRPTYSRAAGPKTDTWWLAVAEGVEPSISGSRVRCRPGRRSVPRQPRFVLRPDRCRVLASSVFRGVRCPPRKGVRCPRAKIERIRCPRVSGSRRGLYLAKRSRAEPVEQSAGGRRRIAGWTTARPARCLAAQQNQALG